MTLGKVLRDRRLQLGLSCKDVSNRAEKLGVSIHESTVRYYEQGSIPKIDKLLALAKVLDMDINLLTQLAGITDSELSDVEQRALEALNAGNIREYVRIGVNHIIGDSGGSTTQITE